MKKITRFTALAAAAVISLTSAVSCGNSSKSKTKTPQTADQLLTNSYKSSDLTLPDISGIQSIKYDEELGEYVLIGYDSNYNTIVYSTDEDFTAYKELGVNNSVLGIDDDSDTSSQFEYVGNGNFVAIVTDVTHGDIEEPDWDDPDFDYDSFDYDAYYAASEYSIKVCELDSDGNILSENDVSGFENCNVDSSSNTINVLSYCGNDTLFVALYDVEGNSIYTTLGVDGKLGNQINVGDSENTWINYVGTDKDGNVVCDFYDSDGNEQICAIDIENYALGDKLADAPAESHITGIVTGSGDYILYLTMGVGVYGVKEDGTVEEVINWIDSDVPGDYVDDVVSLENGDFLVVITDYTTGDSSLSLLTKRDTSELADTKVITMGMLWSDTEVNEKVTEFNKSNSEYRIQIKDYSEYDVYDDEEEAYTSTAIGQLKNDIIAGNGPDLICVYNDEAVSSLASKGVYADLYTLMENDSEVSKDDFLSNVLTACETDGKLYSIPTSFSVSTFAAKTKFVSDDMENWTIDTFVETNNNLSDGMRLIDYETNKIGMFDGFFTSVIGDCIDYDNNTCNFNSEDFIKFLEFCNTFPDDDPAPDYETATDEEINDYYADVQLACFNDDALMSSVTINNIKDCNQLYQGYFGEDITFVGSPSSDGQGAHLYFQNVFAILNDSSCKDAAWSFIKQFYTEDAQKEIVNYNTTMPVIKSVFDELAEESTETPYYTDDDGNKVEYNDYYYINDKEIVLEPLTEEQKDYIVDYVTSVTKTSNEVDQDIVDICDEEAQAYFAGEKTAEEAAEMMQNRISILISEQN